MTATHTPQAETLRLTVENIPFTALAWGPADGPLALCLHGYPDTARTWRHLGPELAAHGWRVVAPYTRGYAPSGLAPDGAYGVGALARDALALRRVLADDEPAVLIGHDWGAVTAYLAGSYAPGAFRRIVTMAVAPGPVLIAPLALAPVPRRRPAAHPPSAAYELVHVLPTAPVDLRAIAAAAHSEASGPTGRPATTPTTT
jgi:pimeloyl-ACP methyl ester carboxylesterase